MSHEHFGIRLESHHHSIFLVAHLYNSVLQCSYLHTRWPEMDRLIEQHMDVIFGIAGLQPQKRNKVPSSNDS